MDCPSRAGMVALGGYAMAVVALVAAWAVFEPVAVAGGSMRPALDAGDLVLVRRGAPVHVGDIALVREPGRTPVLHRVVEFEPGGTLRLRGDANPVDDFNPVTPDRIEGPVVAVVPLGGLLERWRAR